MTQNEPNREETVAREEAAAAREAGSIGGPGPYDDGEVAPEEQPLREAGQGESEGFEEAETALRENAEHGGATSNIEGFPEEPEQDLAGAAYGEPDQVENPDRGDSGTT